MNTLFLSLLYHPDDLAKTAGLSRDGLQNQINSYQWAFIEGLRQNLREGENLSVVNALPVGVFPTRYCRLFLRGSVREGDFREIGGVNLPWLKQRGRRWRAQRELERWIASSPQNRTVLLYSLYMPFMQAVAKVKRRHPDVKAAIIVTDLPNELGIASGRTGWLKKAEYAMGNRRMTLCCAFDGFALLTEPMAEALNVTDKPWIVMEGLISENAPHAGEATVPADSRPAVLYTGTLNRELGIAELLDAFRGMDAAQLWVCGKGDMEIEVAQAAKDCDNIRWFGYVPQATALALQEKADALINPRTAQGVFTRYSFPSKTLEYMRAGKPLLCCKLEGIPREYDPWLCYIEPQTSEGIRTAVKALLALPREARAEIGQKAQAFVLKEKNPRTQCRKLLDFLRALQTGER